MYTSHTQPLCITFNWDYNPMLHEQSGHPYQNFTMTVPSESSVKKGNEVAIEEGAARDRGVVAVKKQEQTN